MVRERPAGFGRLAQVGTRPQNVQGAKNFSGTAHHRLHILFLTAFRGRFRGLRGRNQYEGMSCSRGLQSMTR